MNIKTKEDLRALRASTGLSQERFAQAVGVSFSLINKIEYGDRVITRYLQLAIKDALNEGKIGVN